MDKHVYLFVSRNKDNKDICDFKERREAYFTDSESFINRKFEEFVAKGKENELCRMYRNINRVNEYELRIALIHKLVDDNVNLAKIEGNVVSLASKKENQDVCHWLWDFDENIEVVKEFVKIISKYPYMLFSVVKTVNNYSVITNRFDTREVDQWIKEHNYNIENKRADGMLLMRWAVKLADNKIESTNSEVEFIDVKGA